MPLLVRYLGTHGIIKMMSQKARKAMWNGSVTAEGSGCRVGLSLTEQATSGLPLAFSPIIGILIHGF